MGAHVERKAIRKAAIFAALSFAVCCAVFVPTQPAWAGIAEDINGWLCDMLRGPATCRCTTWYAAYGR